LTISKLPGCMGIIFVLGLQSTDVGSFRLTALTCRFLLHDVQMVILYVLDALAILHKLGLIHTGTYCNLCSFQSLMILLRCQAKRCPAHPWCWRFCLATIWWRERAMRKDISNIAPSTTATHFQFQVRWQIYGCGTSSFLPEWCGAWWVSMIILLGHWADLLLGSDTHWSREELWIRCYMWIECSRSCSLGWLWLQDRYLGCWVHGKQLMWRCGLSYINQPLGLWIVDGKVGFWPPGW
jgi:hypothetical protein